MDEDLVVKGLFHMELQSAARIGCTPVIRHFRYDFRRLSIRCNVTRISIKVSSRTGSLRAEAGLGWASASVSAMRSRFVTRFGLRTSARPGHGPDRDP